MFGLRRELERQREILTHSTRSSFTPDIARLEGLERHNLFVCDEWMSDRRQSFVLEELGGRREIHHAWTMHPLLFLTHVGHFDDGVTVPLNGLAGRRKIKGEVWSVPPTAFISLDKLRLNGVKFRRDRVYVICPNRPSEVFENVCDDYNLTHGHFDRCWNGKFPDGHPLAGKKYRLWPERVYPMRVWMYLGHPEYWNRIVLKHPYQFNEVNSFKPKQSKKWLSEYYKFQNPS